MVVLVVDMRREEVVGIIIIVVFVAGAIEAVILPHIYTPQPMEFLQKILPSGYWEKDVSKWKFGKLELVKNYYKSEKDLPADAKLVVKVDAKSCILYVRVAENGIAYNISAYRPKGPFVTGTSTPVLEVSESVSENSYIVEIDAKKGVIVIEVSSENIKEMDVEASSAVIEIDLATPSLADLDINTRLATTKILLSELNNTSITLRLYSTVLLAQISYSDMTTANLNIETESSKGNIEINIPEDASVQLNVETVVSSIVSIEIPEYHKILTSGQAVVGKIRGKGLLVTVEAYSTTLSLTVRQ